MTASTNVATLELFRSLVAPKGAYDPHRPGRKVSIYTLRVVAWLMIAQHLLVASMADIVAQAKEGAFGNLIPERKRGKMSLATGGYAKARARIRSIVILAVAMSLYDELDSRLAARRPELNRPVKLLDGSSLQLESSEELKQAFPPAKNQHGSSHWPTLKIATILDAQTGLVWRAAWGPMYGPGAVSEQGLVKGLIEQLPESAVLLGDRNFGILMIAWYGTRRGHDVVLRLTKARAQALARRPLSRGMDLPVRWKASAWDRKSHPELPADAQISGRLLVCQEDGWREPVYLFTSLTLPAVEVVKLYGLRWNIETDLRSLKRTVNLHHIDAKSCDMMEKELLMAIAAYNITRTVMFLAAEHAGIPPRKLSFVRVLYVVEAGLVGLLLNHRSGSMQRKLEQLIRDAATCKLPERKKQRSYPRAVWKQRRSFPPKHEPKEIGK